MWDRVGGLPRVDCPAHWRPAAHHPLLFSLTLFVGKLEPMGSTPTNLLSSIRHGKCERNVVRKDDAFAPTTRGRLGPPGEPDQNTYLTHLGIRQACSLYWFWGDVVPS